MLKKKEVNACDKKFSGSTQSPIGDRDDILQKLSDVAAAILKLLLNNLFEYDKIYIYV